MLLRLQFSLSALTPFREGRVASALLVAALAIALAAPSRAEIASPVTKTICPSGCDFVSLVPEARDWLRAQSIVGNGAVTLQLQDGIHDAAGEFSVTNPQGGRVWILGNCAEPGRTVVNFTDTSSNKHGFAATHGGAIGMVDCLVVNGIGARGPGEYEWNSQRYGAGIYAYGSGSWIRVGPRTTVRDFYYTLFADEAASIEANGVRMENAGDCNVLARFSSHIRCLRCHAVGAGHRDTDSQGRSTTLGYNYMAEAGGTIRVDESVGEGGLVASVAAINNGAAWAHRYTGRHSKSGALVFEGGSIELDGAKLHDNITGARGETRGWLSLKYAEIYNSQNDGVLLIGASAGLEFTHIHDNGLARAGGYGLRVYHQGTARGNDVTFSNNKSGNTYVENVDQGCATTADNCRPRSFLYLRSGPVPRLPPDTLAGPH